MSERLDSAVADARARLLHDLAATTRTTPMLVDVLEQSLSERREWAQPWPDGAAYLTCLVAQDLQESLEVCYGRWPPCRVDGMHQLHVEPDLGANPHWVCADCSVVVADIGQL